MKQENTNKNKWLYILITASIIVSITPLLIFVFMHRLPNITPYTAGRSIVTGIILGSAMLTIIPLLVDWCVSGFKKKPKRWWLIWLVFLLISIPHSILSRMNDLKIAQFSSECISNILENASLKLEDHNAALKLERLCYSAGEAYVDCINKKGSTKEACAIKAIDTIKTF